MTADEDGPAVGDAEVQAAAERWARAAGVPPSVARGGSVATPAAVRFLGGVLLGLAVGAVLALLVSAAGASAGLWPLLVAGAGLLLAGAVRQRRRTPGPAAGG